MWKDKLTSMSKQKQKRTDDLPLSSNNTNVSNSKNVYPEKEANKRKSNQQSQQQNVLSSTESDLTDIKIIEDPNQAKERDIIDLTNLDGEKEHDSSKQDVLDKNRRVTYQHKKKKSNDEKDSAFRTHEMGYNNRGL